MDLQLTEAQALALAKFYKSRRLRTPKEALEGLESKGLLKMTSRGFGLSELGRLWLYPENEGQQPKYQIGQRLWIHWPNKREHGMSGVVTRIFKWDGAKGLDSFCYRAHWKKPGEKGFVSSPGERFVKNEKPNKVCGRIRC